MWLLALCYVNLAVQSTHIRRKMLNEWSEEPRWLHQTGTTVLSTNINSAKKRFGFTGSEYAQFKKHCGQPTMAWNIGLRSWPLPIHHAAHQIPASTRGLQTSRRVARSAHTLLGNRIQKRTPPLKGNGKGQGKKQGQEGHEQRSRVFPTVRRSSDGGRCLAQYHMDPARGSESVFFGRR